MYAIVAFDAKVFELGVIRVVRDLCLEEIDELLLVDQVEVVLEAVVDDPSQPLVNQLVVTEHRILSNQLIPNRGEILLA